MQFDTTINDWHTCPASGADPRLQPVLGIHVPRRHGLQSRLAEPAARSTTARDRQLRRRRLSSTPCRLWTIVLEISVLMAQFPSQRDRRALLRLPHARPRLRQYRRPADDHRASPTTRDEGRAHLRRAHRDHDRHLLRDLGRDGGRARRLPRLRDERRRTCCASSATTAAPPTATPTATRRCAITPVPLDHASCPRRRRWSRMRHAAWDRRARARRAARLPQRAGDGDRADRHDRPRHGLRHHRHRARLRAGEVQEARRRRLLQDHQPRRARGAARARLSREPRSPRSRPMPSATARSTRRPASTLDR